MLKFDAGIFGCEVPIGFGVVTVSVVLPSRDVVDEGLAVWHAAIEALRGQNAEFGFACFGV